MRRLILALLATLLAACCPVTRKPVAFTNPATRHVVLVHGFLENGTTFEWLKRRLEKRGVVCLVPKLRPCDGRGGLEGLAVRLKQDIDAAYGPNQRISIISFSMGGLVSRYYLQSLGGAARCDHLFTISSPHHGTTAAWCYPSQGAVQMRPGSQFLTDLENSQSRLGKMPVVSYRTPLDTVIVPPTSSVWDRAVNREFLVLMHPLMLNSYAVAKDIEQQLLE